MSNGVNARLGEERWSGRAHRQVLAGGRAQGLWGFAIALALLAGCDPGPPQPMPGSAWQSSAGMEFAWIPAGSFEMGSPADEAGRDDDERQHEVRISQGFWMGKYEVTQGEWDAVTGENPSHFDPCDRCPVESVSWAEVDAFIRELNATEAGSGNAYRLPTEAEWEYAARAGTTGARYGELGEIAWYEANSEGRTRLVGAMQANTWGLHDMLGNVWEWTADWYGEYPSGLVTDPAGPSSGSERVLRGGGYRAEAVELRAANRIHFGRDFRRPNIGFRLVREE